MTGQRIIATGILFCISIAIFTTLFIQSKYVSESIPDSIGLKNCTSACYSHNKAFTNIQIFCNSRKILFDTEESLIRKFGNFSNDEQERALTKAVHFIGYGNDRFQYSKRRIRAEAEQYGLFSSISMYGPMDLSAEFRKIFHNVLNQSRGGGYWIWKFYIIKEALEKAKEGEFIFYLDSGSSLIPKTQSRFSQYMAMIERSDYDVLVHNGGPYTEEYFLSGPILSLFDLRNSRKFLDSTQISAAFILLKKSYKSASLIDTALEILRIDRNLITVFYGDCCTTSTFRENRHDQSIFSVLLKCNGFIRLDETYRNKCKRGVACLTRKRK